MTRCARCGSCAFRNATRRSSLRRLPESAASFSRSISHNRGMIERRALQLLIFIVAAVLMALGLDPNLAVYDEGFILPGAPRVSAGAIPPRVFSAHSDPAT